jgi:hypothetical protein
VREKSPTIPFVSMLKKMDKVDGRDADKFEWIKLEFLVDTALKIWINKGL